MNTAAQVIAIGALSSSRRSGRRREPAGARHRVIVSTDIGGTDPDDFQSMVHLLLYADVLDIEGLVSSPYGPGRQRAHPAGDRPLRAGLSEPEDLFRPVPDARCIAGDHQAGRHRQCRTVAGVGEPTEGSEWIVQCARRDDPRPLYVLVWGGIEDLAQALHDAPDILPKLRVYFIGGPNKMWSVDAYNYIEQHHPKLWIIEANATYRGWFTGGNQAGDWGNAAFVAAHVAGRGALGEFFATQLKGTIKMGDRPSVGYLLHGAPDDPTQPGWGGRFVRIWDGRKTVFDRLTTEADQAEVFGVVEFALPVPAGHDPRADARMIFDNRIPAAGSERRPCAALPLLAARREGVALCDSQRLRRRSTDSRAVHRRAAAGRPHQPAVDAPSQLVDRRSRPCGRRGRSSRREEREPLARGISRATSRSACCGAQAPKSRSMKRSHLPVPADRHRRRLPGPAAGQARVLVLTDIENEPDDTQSMVRFLCTPTSGTSRASSPPPRSISATGPPRGASGSSSRLTARCATIW